MFYANDILLDLPRPARLQAVLYVLKVLFDRVVLQTNLDKTVVLV